MNKYILLALILFFCLSCNRYGKTTNIPVSNKTGLSSDTGANKSFEEEEKPIVFLAEISRVVDGDTVEIIYHELILTLRLAHIDAPESWGNQPYGEAAKKKLTELCAGQTIRVSTAGEFDGFGRLIAVLIDGNGVNLNKKMVRTGYAWHYKKYSKDSSYTILQNEARHHKRGLWQNQDAVAPWDFR